MKKFVVFMAIAIVFLTFSNVFAQSAASNLRNYCVIDQHAEFILNNAEAEHTQNLEMSEYAQDVDGTNFAAQMAVLYQWGKDDVPLKHVAADFWLLISKQLHGEEGQLTLEKLNFIPTKNSRNEFVLAIVMWNKKRQQWTIMSMPLFEVKTLYKGARMFSKQS